MKKIRFKDIKDNLPLTVQNAHIKSLKDFKYSKGVKTINYQCDNSSPQQFYKPISKILSF